MAEYSSPANGVSLTGSIEQSSIGQAPMSAANEAVKGFKYVLKAFGFHSTFSRRMLLTLISSKR